MEKAKLFFFVLSLLLIVLCLLGCLTMAYLLPNDSTDRMYFCGMSVVFFVVAIWFSFNLRNFIRQS